MNRRGFLGTLLGFGLLAALPLPPALAPEAWIQGPGVETFWLPPTLCDKSDPLGQRGYAGAKCEVGGKSYGAVLAYDARSDITESDARAEAERALLAELRTAAAL